MQIIAWKCDHTGKLFEDKEKYQKHLRKLAAERRQKEKQAALLKDREVWWRTAQNEYRSINEFPQWVIDNQDRFWAEAVKSWSRYGNKKAKSMPLPEILEFHHWNVRWSDHVSNSHSCPHTGVTNWWGRGFEQGRHLPTGYPGWTGRAGWTVRCHKGHEYEYPGADLFYNSKLIRVHTGTGGGGGHVYDKKYGCNVQRFEYSISIFADDWPGLAKHEVFNMLKR